MPQKGKQNRSFVNKKSEKAVTFTVVAAPDNDKEGVLLPKVPLKAGKNASLVNELDPELFGISSKLPQETFEMLCMEVYGELPLSCKGRQKRSREVMTERDLEKLETAECYFPLDGYDYDQHLVTAKRPYIPQEEEKIIPRNAEEQAVLEALEHSPCGSDSELEDDFTTLAGKPLDEDELLWGSRKQELGFIGISSAYDRKTVESEFGLHKINEDAEYSDSDLQRLLQEEYSTTEVDYKKSEKENKADALLRQHVVHMSKKYTEKEIEDDVQTLQKETQTKTLDLIAVQAKEPLKPWNQNPRAPPSKWDCESILSTYSNIYNNPSVINRPISKNLKKIGLAPQVSDDKNDDAPAINENYSSEEEQSEDSKSDLNKDVPCKRNPNETPEEKHERKMKVKLAKRKARQQKKEEAQSWKTCTNNPSNPYDVKSGIRRIKIIA